MGDMEHVDIYGVYMGQKEIFVFMLPSSYEGSLQIERRDWSKMENSSKKQEEYVIYMERNVTKYNVE